MLYTLLPVFHKAYGKAMGISVDDILPRDENICQLKVPQKPDGQLPHSTYHLLARWISSNDDRMLHQPIHNCVHFRTSIKRLDQLFKPQESSHGDSGIIFRTGDAQLPCSHLDNWSAGYICAIFSHTRTTSAGLSVTQTFAVVNEMQQLSQHDSAYDHFREFPIAGGRLFYAAPKHQPVLVCVDDILCHCACTPLDIPTIHTTCLHVLPLDKVSYPRDTCT
jgi:hypothetical protein